MSIHRMVHRRTIVAYQTKRHRVPRSVAVSNPPERAERALDPSFQIRRIVLQPSRFFRCKSGLLRPFAQRDSFIQSRLEVSP